MSDKPKTPSHPQPPPRLTVVETIYHQTPPEQPLGIARQFSRNLESHEQPYGPRRLTATADWQPLLDDKCWIDDASLIYVENTEGKRLAVNPTPEEREALAARVLEIGVELDEADHLAIVALPHGETSRMSLADGVTLFIRCPGGDCRYSLTVFPR